MAHTGLDGWMLLLAGRQASRQNRQAGPGLDEVLQSGPVQSCPGLGWALYST